MSQQAITKRSPGSVAQALDTDTLNKLVMSGNLAGLKPDEQRAYYIYRCKLLDLDPATQPFDLITLQGKLTLYAKKECASQLASKRNLSATIVEQGIQGDLYVVQARCKGGDGRETDDLGAVSIKGKSGDDLCNAMMKAATKAKRRAILTHCGLGMLDESELDTVRNGWGGSGSKEAAQAVAAEKLAQFNQQASVDLTEIDAATEIANSGTVALPGVYSNTGHESTTPAPSVATTATPAPNPAIVGARPKPKTLNYDFLQRMKVKATQLGRERYEQVLGNLGYEHSNEITKPEAQEAAIKAMQQAVRDYLREIELGGGGKLYDKMAELFEDPEVAIAKANILYHSGGLVKKGPAQVDAEVLLALESGMTHADCLKEYKEQAKKREAAK